MTKSAKKSAKKKHLSSDSKYSKKKAKAAKRLKYDKLYLFIMQFLSLKGTISNIKFKNTVKIFQLLSQF